MPPPFRADHIGSLIRPESLLSARQAHDKLSNASDSHTPAASRYISSSSSITIEYDTALPTSEDAAIAEVVKTQLSLGVTPVTTGEYERWIFYGGFFTALSGIEERYCDFTTDVRLGLPQATTGLKMGIKGRPVEKAVARVTYTESPNLPYWLKLRALLGEDAKWGLGKVTLPSPAWFHMQWRDGLASAPGVYANDRELLADVASCLRQELMVLYEHGLRVAQIDDPNLTFFCDEEGFVKASREAGKDLEALLDMHIEAHNLVLQGLPDDMVVGVHLCRGNYPGGVGIASGGYKNIARRLLRDLSYKLFYLEFDSDRAGDFEPLAVLPADKAVVLGVVTTKFADMEDLETLRARVYQAADVIATGQGRTRDEVLKDNLAVSPQCGFASVNFGKGVGFTMDVMWKKLELVKQLAAEIWPRG